MSQAVVDTSIIVTGDQLVLDAAWWPLLGSTYAASRMLPGETETQVRPEVEVVFDLPADAPDTGHAGAADLATDVRRLRHDIVTCSRDRGHGSADEALELLAPHRSAPEGVVVSALLVCTHRRFVRCSRTLLRRLATDGLLADHQLDELAGMLLWEDRARFAVPSTWRSTWLEVPPGTRVRAPGYEVVPPDEGGQTFPYVHDVPAAARRWAARLLLESGRTDVDAVLARIGELADGAAGAVLCGVLDSWEACPPADLEPAVRAALGSGLASVRLRALDVLARTGRRDEAVALARDDGAPQVRRWQPPADALARTPDQPTLLG